MPVFIEVMAEEGHAAPEAAPPRSRSQPGPKPVDRAQQGYALSRFDGLASYERARASLEKEFIPEHLIARRCRASTSRKVISVGEPSPYSPDERIDRALAESGASPRKCFQRIARMRLGMEEEAKKHLAVIIREVEKNSGAIQLITGVQSILGRRDELKDTFILPKGQDALAEARAAEAAIEGDTGRSLARLPQGRGDALSEPPPLLPIQ